MKKALAVLSLPLVAQSYSALRQPTIDDTNNTEATIVLSAVEPTVAQALAVLSQELEEDQRYSALRQPTIDDTNSTEATIVPPTVEPTVAQFSEINNTNASETPTSHSTVEANTTRVKHTDGYVNNDTNITAPTPNFTFVTKDKSAEHAEAWYKDTAKLGAAIGAPLACCLCVCSVFACKACCKDDAPAPPVRTISSLLPYESRSSKYY